MAKRGGKVILLWVDCGGLIVGCNCLEKCLQQLEDYNINPGLGHLLHTARVFHLLELPRHESGSVACYVCEKTYNKPQQVSMRSFANNDINDVRAHVWKQYQHLYCKTAVAP